jgi:hypothetical protein
MSSVTTEISHRRSWLSSFTRRWRSRGNKTDKYVGPESWESRGQSQVETTTAISQQLNWRRYWTGDDDGDLSDKALSLPQGLPALRIEILNWRRRSLNPTRQFESVRRTYRPKDQTMVQRPTALEDCGLHQLGLTIFWQFRKVIFSSHAFVVSRRFNESWRNTNVETVDLCMEGTSSLVPGKKSDTCPTWKRESALDYYLIVSNTKRRHYIRRRRRLANKNRIQHGVVEGNHKPIKKLL